MDCGCKLRFPRWTFSRDMGMMKGARWRIPMVRSGHGRECVGIILWRRLRVWWKPAQCYDRTYIPVGKRKMCTIGGIACSHEQELEKTKLMLVSEQAVVEALAGDKLRIAKQRDRIYRAYREACKRSGELPMTRETFL